MKEKLIFAILLLTIASCDKADEALTTRITAIEINETEVTLNIGEEYQFSVSYTPSDETEPKYNWVVDDVYPWGESSARKIAEIDQKGKLKALDEGETIVTVSTTDVKDKKGHSFFSQCRLIIKTIPVTEIKLETNELTLNIGDSSELEYTLLPENASIKKVNWRSANRDIATVEDGVIKAVSPGVTEITIQAANDKKAVCKVIVNPS